MSARDRLPLILDQAIAPAGLIVPSYYPVNPSAGVSLPTAAANTPGAWVEVIPVGTFALPIVLTAVQVGAVSATSSFVQVDIALGASGSEVPAGRTAGYFGGTAFMQPPYPFARGILVPAGSRVAARRILTSTGTVDDVHLVYYPLG